MNKIRHGDKILIYKHFEGVFFLYKYNLESEIFRYN